MRRLLALASVFAFTACGPTEPPDYDDLTGSYRGPIQGTGDGKSLHGGVTLSLTQSAGDLSGDWTTVFDLHFDGYVSLWRGIKNVNGTLSEGRDPRISFNFPRVELDTGRSCPGTTTLSGTHSSQDGQVQLSGQIMLMEDSCRQLWATLDVTVSLS